MQYLKWIKGCFQSELLAQPLVATILALVFAPFSIYLGFEINARLSKPVLSIEYVSRYDDKAYVNRAEIERTIDTITNDSLFGIFRNNHINQFQVFDLSSLFRSNDETKLTASLNKLRLLLSAEINKEKTHINELPKKDAVDKRILISHLSSFDESMEDEEINNKIIALYHQKIKDAENLQSHSDNLEQLMKKSSVTITRINVSLLNKGSTDGLIRNLGYLTYNNIKFRIKKIPPPKSASNLLAVPTYVVNESFGLYFENSIGKIKNNTMSEFWFLVDATNKKVSICDEGGFYLLELLDQDKKTIKKQLPCN